MQFRLAKKRKSSLDEALIPTKKVLNLKYRVGSTTRKFFRHIFEHKSIKNILGGNIALMLFASSLVPSGLSAANINEIEPKVAATSIVATENPIETTISLRNPVEVVSITQGYKFYHPGLDLDGVTGDKIRPIKSGVVIYAISENFGYGKHVVIDHGNGMTTLYAHLSKIMVKNGQEVTTTTILGEMGATGRSFGDHLHFEVRNNGVAINPAKILPL